MSRVGFTFTTRRPPPGGSGLSVAPYDDFNLAAHVGDAPGAVEANRAALAISLGVARDRLLFMQQVHGDAVQVVSDPSWDEVPATDALVTAEPGLALVVLVADCLPVLLVDESRGVIAAVHAGRRGIAAGIVERTVDLMGELGAGGISARIGPGVCADCYEVSEEVHAEVSARVPDVSSRTPQGGRSLDLRAGVVGQLTRLGIDRLTHDRTCTAQAPSLYSYRRDGITGRFAGVVVNHG